VPVRDEESKDKRTKIEEAIKELEAAGFKDKAEHLKERLKKLAQPGGEPKEKTKKPAGPATDKDIRQNLEEMLKRLVEAGQLKAADHVKEALRDLSEAKPKSDTKPDNKKPAPLPDDKDWRGRTEEAIKRMEEAIKRLEGAGFKEQADQVKEALAKMRQAGAMWKGKFYKPGQPADRDAEIEKKLDQLTRELEELRRELKKQKPRDER